MSIKNKILYLSKLIKVKPFELKRNLEKYKGEIIVIKYGGSAMLDPELSSSFSKDIEILVGLGVKPIIVHGGGPQINELLDTMKIKYKFLKGMRITDKKTFRIVEMVLSGMINKNISLNLSRKGVSAIGLSGCDSGMILVKKLLFREKKRIIDLGYVGKPYKLNKIFIKQLLDLNIIPVIAPIGYNSAGIKFNINADLTAGFIAHNLNSRRLLMLTDVSGVKDNNDQLITELKLKEVKSLISKNIIYGGMIPKVNTCIETVSKGVRASVIIDGRVKHALLKELLSDKGVGTLFRK